MKKELAWMFALGTLLVLFAVQLQAITRLKAEVAALRAQTEQRNGDSGAGPAPSKAADPTSFALGNLPQRVSQLEHSVASLSKASEILMERGLVPASADRIEHLQGRLSDPSATDRDRLGALRVLKRNGGMNDELALQAVNWLQTATNASTRRDVLQQLDGLTNGVLKKPLLGMLATESEGSVREELVDALGEFMSDPSVEQRMWDLASGDADEDVREEAEDALTSGRMTPERVEALRQKATDPSLSLDTRLIALKGLSEAGATAPEAVAEMAQLAQNATDPLVRAKLFDAFDDLRDSSLMLPLIQGLQDPNPGVRERAADALSSYSADERIQQWLNHVLENDNDPRVKREAFRTLEESRNRRERNN